MIKEYAVLNLGINEINDNLEWIDNSKVMFTSQNKDEIVDYLKSNDLVDDSYSVEIYFVDDGGEFIQGSDFDVPSNFIK